jgi:hypothetical protein
MCFAVEGKGRRYIARKLYCLELATLISGISFIIPKFCFFMSVTQKLHFPMLFNIIQIYFAII